MGEKTTDPVPASPDQGSAEEPMPPKGSVDSWRRVEVIGTILVPLVAFVATFVIMIMQLALTAEQTRIADRQAELASQQTGLMNRQTEILDKQARIMETQADIARTPISPKFTFDSDDNFFQATNTGERVLNLEGTCVPYTTVGKKHIELIGHTQREGFTIRSATLHFGHPFELSKQLLVGILEYKNRFSITYFVELSYTNMVGERRTERYITDSSGARLTPVSEMPRMDDKLDLRPFLQQTPPDYKSAVKAFNDKILEWKKKEGVKDEE
jgi:hypothetical protein